MDLFSQAIETTTNPVNTGLTYAFGGFILVWTLIIILIGVIALWKVFEKAGHPGWKSLIPFYNTYILVTIAGRPGWWFLLLFIPVVNLVVYIILSLDIAKAFGKSPVFAIVGLWMFNFIGYMILGWGDSTYTKPGTQPQE